MSRDYRLFLEDINDSCKKVMRYTMNLNRAHFFADEKTYDAVVRNLEIIGEAAKHLPEEVQKRYPQIEWRKIGGFRDVVVHEYFGIDEDILWDIIQIQVPELLEKITEMLKAGNAKDEAEN